MSAGKEIGKATWENYKAPFFKWLERKAKEGAKRYTILGKVRDAWMQLDWGYAEQEYLKYIYEFHSQFHIFGIQETVKLDELSTDVFVLEKPEFRKYKQSEATTKIGGLKLAFQDKRGQKLFVWGEPGSGKTTFLKQILSYAIETTENIPLFINIAEWAATYPVTKDGLRLYLAEQFKRCGFYNATFFIEYIIEAGKALLLFDGLDEISREHQENILLLLEQNKESKSQIIISCRVDAITKRLEGFWEVQVARWDEHRILDFIEKRIPNKKLREKFLKELNDEKKKSLKDFKKNPLLLSLLCSAFDPEKGFPENRAEIYFEATRHLLIERDQEKAAPIRRDTILKNLSLEKKETLYALLAYNSFSKEKLYFTQQEIEKEISTILVSILKDTDLQIDSNEILPNLISQHGILSHKGHRTYAFSHLSLQEYYAAKYISDNIDRDALNAITPYLQDNRWKEVIFLTASLAKDATQLFCQMQNAMQTIVDKKPRMREIQKWILRRTIKSTTDNKNVKRIVYWYILLNFPPTNNKIYNYALELHQEIEKASQYMSYDNQGDIALVSDDLELTNNRIQDIKRKLVRDYIYFDDQHTRFLNFALEIPIKHNTSLRHLLDTIININIAIRQNIQKNQISDSEFVMKNSLSNYLDLAFDLTLEQIINEQDVFITDFSANNLCLFVLSLSMLNQNQRFKGPVEKTQKIAAILWNKESKKSDGIYSFSYPSHTDSTERWGDFFQTSKYMAKLILDINEINSTSTMSTQKYLDANQFFWDCLQVATVEDREAIEDMIFNVPEGWKPPEENGAN